MKPKKIVYYVNQWWAVSWYRAHVPGSTLKALGHEVQMTDSIDRHWVEECDVLVTLPAPDPRLPDVVRMLKARGALTVLDTDDDYWSLHPENPSRWTNEMLDLYATIARDVDLVTIASPELMGVMKALNCNVRVLPNTLLSENWPKERKHTKPDGEPLVLGWAGGTSHAPDLRLVYPVLLQLLDEFPTLEVQIAGLVTDDVPVHPRLVRPRAVRIEEYPDLLAGFDIAIAPLLDSRFNRCKSDLKFLEYGMVGLPTVASPVAPYARSINQGVNGYLAKNNKDWLKYLRLLINDSAARDRVAAKARAFAETRLITDNIDRWVKAYGLEDTSSS